MRRLARQDGTQSFNSATATTATATLVKRLSIRARFYMECSCVRPLLQTSGPLMQRLLSSRRAKINHRESRVASRGTHCTVMYCTALCVWLGSPHLGRDGSNYATRVTPPSDLMSPRGVRHL